MKYLNKISVIGLISALITWFSFQSCIDEDSENCPVTSARVYFNYTPKNGYTGIRSADVNSITLFLFDSLGTYVNQYTDKDISLTDKYYLPIDPKPGKYSFVAWANLNDPYLLNPSSLEGTNINDVQVYFNRAAEDTIKYTVPPLFFGRLNNVQVKPVRDQKFNVKIIQNTNKINFKVRGIPVDTDDYAFIITDNNGKYSFNDDFLSDNNFNYKAITKFDSKNELNTSLTVLRLAQNRHPELKIYNQRTGKLVYKENLVYLINILSNQGRAVDWPNTYEFDIVLVFENTGTGEVLLTVTVSVNGWVVIDDGVEVHV